VQGILASLKVLENGLKLAAYTIGALGSRLRVQLRLGAEEIEGPTIIKMAAAAAERPRFRAAFHLPVSCCCEALARMTTHCLRALLIRGLLAASDEFESTDCICK
jgi:hypothetical protein